MSQFVLNSTVQQTQFVLLKITKEVVSVQQALPEIQMIETAVELKDVMNVQQMLNVLNLMFAKMCKESLNVYQPARKLSVDHLLFA